MKYLTNPWLALGVMLICGIVLLHEWPAKYLRVKHHDIASTEGWYYLWVPAHPKYPSDVCAAMYFDSDDSLWQVDVPDIGTGLFRVDFVERSAAESLAERYCPTRSKEWKEEQ